MTSIAILLGKEILLLIIGRIPWKVITERLFTRILVKSLIRLEKLSTNDVVDNTINDILASLKGKRLIVIEEELSKREKVKEQVKEE